jgi:hypothetical protein
MLELFPLSLGTRAPLILATKYDVHPSDLVLSVFPPIVHFNSPS